MNGLIKTCALLFASTLFIIGGCSQKSEKPAAAKTPQVSLSCTGVMPVVSSSDYEDGNSFSEAKQLKDGAIILEKILHQEFLGREDMRFVSKARLYEMGEAGSDTFLAQARKIGNFLSCNGVLEITLWRYKDRVGGQYTAKEPASVSFTYRLVESNSGTMLCQGRFDEVQKSVMENLYNFSTAVQRGFTWVTAEELLREGVKEKLADCSYLQPVE